MGGEKFGDSNENYSSNPESTSPLNDGGLDLGQKNNKNKIENEIQLAKHEFTYRITNAYLKSKSPEAFQKTGVNLLATHPLFDIIYNLENGSGIDHYQDYQTGRINELNHLDANAKNIDERSIMEENAIPTLLFKYFNEEDTSDSQTKKQISEKIREVEYQIMDLKLALDEIEANSQSLIASDMDPDLLMEKMTTLNAEKNSILRETIGLKMYIDAINQIMEDTQYIRNANVLDNVMDQIKKDIEDNNGEISLNMLNNFRQDFSSKRASLLNDYPELKNADAKVNEFFDDIFKLLELSEFHSMSDSEKEVLVSSQLTPQILEFITNSEIINKIDDPKYQETGITSAYNFILEAELALIGGYFKLDLD